MQILFVLALVLSVALAEHAPRQPVSNLGLWLSLSVVSMFVAPAFAFAASTFVVGSLRRSDTCPSLARKKFVRLRNAHALLWLGIVIVTLWQLGWVQIVRFNWNLADAVLVDDLLILFPLLGSLILSWAAFYDADRTIDASCTSSEASSDFASRAQYLSFHTRHNLLLLLIPAVAVLAAQDLVKCSQTHLSPNIQGWLLLLPVVAVALFFPVVLRFIWNTTALPAGPLRNRLTTQGRCSGLKATNFFVWQTNHRMVNAAVAGFIRPLRYVFFTDALLRHFTDEEVEAVLAHEIGHVRRHHVPDRFLALLLPVLMWNVLGNLFPALPQSLHSALPFGGTDVLWHANLISPVLLIFYAATVFATHARLLEYEADLFAVRTLCSSNTTHVESCQLFENVLEKLASIGRVARDRRSWLHPSINERIAFLQQVAGSPAIGRRFELRMRLRRIVIGWGISILLVCLALTSA